MSLTREDVPEGHREAFDRAKAKGYGDDPNGYPFVWGKVLDIVYAGPWYAVVEYAKPVKIEPNGETKVAYHPYVWGPESTDPRSFAGCQWTDTNHSFGSLDAALVHSIIYRREWWAGGDRLNSKLGLYVMRLLPGDEKGMVDGSLEQLANHRAEMFAALQVGSA